MTIERFSPEPSLAAAQLRGGFSLVLGNGVEGLGNGR